MTKDSSTENFLRANAQVGRMVVPPSKIVTARLSGASNPDEGFHPIDPAPKVKKKRPMPLSLRASNRQRALIKARAGAAGLSINQFLLRLACGPDLAPVKPSKEDRTQRAAALRAFRGTGVLLNQIARHLNSGRIVGAIDITGILKRHEENATLLLAIFLKGAP